MTSHQAQRRKEECAERLQAIFRESGGDAPELRSAVRDLFDELAADCSRTVEDLRRENAMLRGRAEDCRSQSQEACTETLAQVQMYAEELTAANEELRLANEELEEANETLNVRNDELITARKIAEDERERYYDLFDAAPEGYLVTDGRGTILEANHAAAVLLDVHKDSLKGRNLLNFAPIEQQAEIRAMMGRAISAKRRQNFESELRPFMEEPVCVFVSIVAVRARGDEDLSLRWMVRDISERKRAEENLRRHTEELARLNRDLTSAHRESNLYLDILTHDIRNTENVSNLYAELLTDSLQGEAARHMANLQRSIRKSIEILGMVSTIRRIHRTLSDLKPTDLDAVIREASGNIAVGSFHYRGTHNRVWADDLLSVIFNNLIGNAVKHGGPGVEVTVRVEETDDMVLVSVEDTGPGVPDEAKEAIFHRYEQQKRGVGEGLGLYLVQILVEHYGGRVWVEDRVPGHPGEGAAFRFTLKKVA